MVWKEVTTALNENRRELVLSGKEISKRIEKSGLDLSVFGLTNLNYLCISETTLVEVPDEVYKLVNLQTLVMHTNAITKVSPSINKLEKLKVLDLSHNQIKSIAIDFDCLQHIVSINLCCNQLDSFPSLSKNSKLSVLNLSNNKLNSFPDICYQGLSNLAELHLNHNEIDVISENIGSLSGIKVLLLNSNKVTVIPGEVNDCSKLKEIDLKENPIKDKRLLKLIERNHAKQVLDYIKQNCKRTTSGKEVQQNKNLQSKNTTDSQDEEAKSDYKIIVCSHNTNNSLKITVTEDVKEIRPYIVACVVQNVKFSEETFRKFIQIQTKLHDTICNKRTAATIATHDRDKLNGSDLIYTAVPPNQFVIKPLNGVESLTGADLFTKLQKEAEQIRKEKKRNTYSGIHKYLSLVEKCTKYSVVMNASKEIISFPPITNSDITKICLNTTSMLIEVTSGSSWEIARKAADVLLKDLLMLFGNSLTVQQVQNVDVDGNFKFVYPSRIDLVFDKSDKIVVERL